MLRKDGPCQIGYSTYWHMQGHRLGVNLVWATASAGEHESWDLGRTRLGRAGITVGLHVS